MSIQQQIVKGVFWSAIEKYSGLLISIIISSILARLILPVDFGVIAIASVLLTFVSIFSDLGIGPAIVQRKDLSESDLNSIFTISIGVGIVLSVSFFFCSNLIAEFYNNEQLIIVCRLLSIKLLFTALNVVPQATLIKNKEFKKIAKRTLLFNTTTGILSVYAAFHGAGLYALLITPLVTPFGMLVYNLRLYPRRVDLNFCVKPFRKIYSYSIFQFLFTLMNFFSRNLDSLIIGRFFPLRELGFYEKSYRLMMLPLQNVTHVITPVIQPIFSFMQDDFKEMSNKYNLIMKLVASISFPLSVFLFFAGKEIITVMYGDNWSEAIPVFEVLSLSLSLQMLLSTTGAIYQSANSTKWMFFNGVINTLVTVSGFFIAAFFYKSIVAIAWSWTITLTFNFLSSFFILYKVVFRESVIKVFKPLFVPFSAAIVCYFILNYIDPFLNFGNIFNALVKFFVVVVMSTSIIQLTGYYNLYHIIRQKF